MDGHNEPEPDLGLLTKHPTTYFDELPHASEVSLVIEVSDTTILYDTTTKMELYASAYIPEYWVVDVENIRIMWFSAPKDGIYQKSQTFYWEDVFEYRGLSLKVSEIIPQKES